MCVRVSWLILFPLVLSLLHDNDVTLCCIVCATSSSLYEQGGPHNHTIAALATALKQVMSPEFKAYSKQVRTHVAIRLLFLPIEA